jgi:glycosyltransferase involved in cell wall biosynthesis
MISILLATYNGEKFIRESIESILNQTFTNFELLIGFNGTTDSSKIIVSNYNDFRIKVFDYGSDKGKAKTLNKLIKKAQYDWIAIQDDDDIWFPKKLEKQIKLINNYDVIGTQIKYIDENNCFIGEVHLSTDDFMIKNLSLNGCNSIANSSAIFKKQAGLKVGGWNENIDGVEDFDFWLKLIKIDCQFKNLETVEVLHRLHSKSNFNNTQKQKSELERMFNKQKG